MELNYLDDFIGIWDNALSPSECNQLITFFEECQKNKYSHTRQQGKNPAKTYEKEDDSISMQYNHAYDHHTDSLQIHDSLISRMVYDKLWPAGSEYMKKYPHAKQSFHYGGYSWKLQKTSKGGGYHIWHDEKSSLYAFRTFFWIFYLNTLEKGGETQFFYKPHTVAPTQGRLLISPSTFEYTHRGNIHWNEKPKYVATGWLYLTPDKENQ